jgi:ribosomal protein S18 acetylase RimI-like enzyme
VWVALHRPDTSGAWVYDIFFEPQHRGKGVGRALLTAAEHDVLQRGVDSIGLTVFGGNHIARRLYESAGYETATTQMRKTL